MLTSFHGFCMSLADSVPGVSGGTIAFIMNFYDDFINSIHDIVGKDKEKRKAAVIYLLKLGIGWAIGMIACILLLSNLFETHVYFLSSLFLGLTIIAVPIVILAEKDCLKGKYVYLLFTVLGIGLVVGLTLLRTLTDTLSIGSFDSLQIWQYFYLFIVGMVAISAMVLPGISGSTILLIAGVYVPVLDAVKEFLSLNFSVLPGLIVFGAGIIIGILIAVRFIRVALKKYRSPTVYCILGLMIGSLFAIIMGPTTLTPAQEAVSFSTFSWWGFILGIVILLGLEALKRIMEKKRKKDE